MSRATLSIWALIIHLDRAWANEYTTLSNEDNELDSENPNECVMASAMGLGLPVLLRRSLDDPIIAIVAQSLAV